MMNDTDLSGLIGTKYATVFVDFGSPLHSNDKIHGVCGYSFNANDEYSRNAAVDVLRNNTQIGYPAFMILTNRFFFGSIHTDYTED